MVHYSGRDPNESTLSDNLGVLKRLLQLLLITYAIFAVWAHFYSSGVMFQPGYGSQKELDGLRYIRQKNGSLLASIYLPNPGAKYTIWFFHGNAEALGDIEPLLRKIQSHGYAVFAFDYPGYGRSSGFPSEQGIYDATAIASRYLHDTLRVPPENIVAYGRSLGGGPAVELAVREPIAGLVLQSAFTSVYRVMTHWPLLPFDKFENLKKLPRVSCPVIVMHGKLDRVVPFDHGTALYAAVVGRRFSFWVDEAGHNNFVQVADSRYWESLNQFMDGLQ